MRIDSYPFIILCYSIIFVCGFVLTKISKFKPASFRFESIDGLRGLLATGVMIHHLIIWYNYLQTGFWKIPNNPIGALIGFGCVYIFFMITGFLFTNKILNSSKQNYTFWKSILLSRIFRLTPAYIFLFLMIIILVFLESNFTLRVSYAQLLKECFEWLTFTIFGNPSINTINPMFFTSGVTWSLPYEWLFYFCLPFLSLIFTRKLNIIAIICSILFLILYFSKNDVALIFYFPFIGGIIPAFIVKYFPSIKLTNHFYSILAIALFGIIIFFRTYLNQYYVIILMSLIFIIISLGNDLFGILKLRFLCFLGEVSYSTYLFHGILIYSTFSLIGIDYLKNNNGNIYAFVSILICILIVLFSYLIYYFIEKKGIDYYKKNYINKK